MFGVTSQSIQYNEIVDKALSEIGQAVDLQNLDNIRVHYLGKKGILTEVLKNIGKLSEAERPKAGQIINEAKQKLLEAIELKKEFLLQKDLNKKLSQNQIDITLPGRKQSQGS